VIPLLLTLAALATDAPAPVIAPAPATAPAPEAAPEAAEPAPGPPISIQHAVDADDVVREASLRLRSELAVAGYSGQIVTCAIDPVNGPAAACPQQEKQDSISLTRNSGTTFIFATWALPKGHTSRRRLHVDDADGGTDSTLIAVRAFELLRDVQVQVAVAAVQDSEAPPVVELSKEGSPVPPPRRLSLWQVQAGGTMVWESWTARQANEPILGIQIGASRRIRPQLAAIAQVAGYKTSLTIADTNGSGSSRFGKSVYQVLGTVGLKASLWTSGLGPFVAFRGGINFMHIDLNADNLGGGSANPVMPMGSLGLGYSVAMSRRLTLNIEGHFDVSQPVEIADTIEADPPAQQTGRLFGGIDVTGSFGL
jgi:hypothetical protein